MPAQPGMHNSALPQAQTGMNQAQLPSTYTYTPAKPGLKGIVHPKMKIDKKCTDL